MAFSVAGFGNGMMFVLMIGSLWIQSEDTGGRTEVAEKSRESGVRSQEQATALLSSEF